VKWPGRPEGLQSVGGGNGATRPASSEVIPSPRMGSDGEQDREGYRDRRPRDPDEPVGAADRGSCCSGAPGGRLARTDNNLIGTWSAGSRRASRSGPTSVAKTEPRSLARADLNPVSDDVRGTTGCGSTRPEGRARAGGATSRRSAPLSPRPTPRDRPLASGASPGQAGPSVNGEPIRLLLDRCDLVEPGEQDERDIGLQRLARLEDPRPARGLGSLELHRAARPWFQA
jgi:hypothetical protein